MRQESMRSAVYRSFVTCDDSKGVIECGTARKSKFCPNKMGEEESACKVNPRGKKKKQTEEGDDERLPGRRSASLQLNEVAREAVKLNRMADSYSSRSSFDGNSKEIGKDLLKGALDLQESLIVLGKLQESSTKMAKMKKKQQNGYSKDCFDELREAIKEGLAKQNLLLRRRCPDMASTSSTSRHSSSSSSSMIEKPNLIAKLMGLDHIPPRTNSYRRQVKTFEDAQPPPIVIIKPARFLYPDLETKEILRKEMIKADQKPVKRLNQELEVKNIRRTRFKHQEDNTGVPRKKKEGIQRRRSKPEENGKSITASKSNSKTKKERIVPISPKLQKSQHKHENGKTIKTLKREEDEESTSPNPKEIEQIIPFADQNEISEEKSIINTKYVLLSSPVFIAYAEELFNVVIDTKLPSNTTAVNSGSENERRLIIDYAKEFMKERCRSRRIQGCTVTLEQLVNDICSEMGRHKASEGGLDAAILKSWDLGRKELDMVVGEIEKMISKELVDNLMTDFLNL